MTYKWWVYFSVFTKYEVKLQKPYDLWRMYYVVRSSSGECLTHRLALWYQVAPCTYGHHRRSRNANLKQGMHKASLKQSKQHCTLTSHINPVKSQLVRNMLQSGHKTQSWSALVQALWTLNVSAYVVGGRSSPVFYCMLVKCCAYSYNCKLELQQGCN